MNHSICSRSTKLISAFLTIVILLSLLTIRGPFSEAVQAKEGDNTSLAPTLSQSSNVHGNATAEEAIDAAVARHLLDPNFSYHYSVQPATTVDEWAYADLIRVDRSSNNVAPSQGSIVLARRTSDGLWLARMPEDEQLYNDWLEQIPNSLVDELIKDTSRWRSRSTAQPAIRPSGHYLPWRMPIVDP